ncbi:MAG: hypothetical protein HFI09_01095 [Bacilli bacterium]|nr:hypothetical protein [Bacilli bacterium]
MTQTKEQKKKVLITIIVLLSIFLPLSICSLTLHILDEKNPRHKIIENPSHEFKFNNKLYFYSSSGTLLGTYECQNSDGICDYASNFDDDKLYAVDYYQSDDAKIGMINNRYSFLIDAKDTTSAKPFLYDFINNRIYTTYYSVKNYGIGIENDLFIVGNDNLKYGVLSLQGEPQVKVKFDYDYIGIANLLNEDENKIMSDLFIGYRDKFWFLLDMNGAVLTSAIRNEIVNYNGKHIIVKENMGYNVVDYEDNPVLANGPYKKLSFTGKYLNILDQDDNFYVYDIASESVITNSQKVKSTDQITSKLNEKGALEVILNEKVIETVEIS